MNKEEIIKTTKGGNVFYKDINGFKRWGREKISCKCGNEVDVWGALNNKRACFTHFAVKCKRCGRLAPMIESFLD